MAVTPRPHRCADGTTRWRVQFRPVKGGIPTSETFETFEDAEKFIRLAEHVGWSHAQKLRDGSTLTSGEVPTLATWFETYLEQAAASLTEGTVAGYRREAQRTWLTQLGPMPLDMLTREMVVQWVGWQRRQETRNSRRARERVAKSIEKAKKGDPVPVMPQPVYVAPKTIENAQRLLSTVLAAADEKYGTGNPARGIQIPGDAVPHEMRVLSRAEFARLYAATDEWYRPLIAFLVGTGCRFGEATALTPEDFDLDADVPTVRIAKAWKKGAQGVYLGAPKSRKSRRTISLSASTVAALRERVESTPDGALVFRSPDGERIRHQNFHPRVWDRALAGAKIRNRPRVHDLRHTHATWLIHEGVPLPVIQSRLGHESIQTTVDTYGHILPDAAAAAASAIERAMGEFDPALTYRAELTAP